MRRSSNATDESRNSRTDLRAAQAVIATLTNERDALQRTLTAERDSQSQAQQTLSARAQEIDQLQGSTEELHARIGALQQQLTAAQTAGNEHLSKVQDLERTLGESQLRRDMLTSEVAAMRARVQQLESEVTAGLTAANRSDDVS